MIKGKWKFLICIMFIACTLFVTSNSLFAAINEDYYNNIIGDMTVTDSSLDEKLKNNTIIDAIGAFIYGIGSLMEWVLGKVFQLITGTNLFPWADAILFNAIPFLDINVFTPANGSLASTLQSFIANTYYTVLALATAFFGIAIMVSAIKLAITAIAEDKAHYKKAIVDWLLGLVMLYGIHFGMSFILYLNEQLVIAASNMASQSIAEGNNVVNNIYNVEEERAESEELVINFIRTMFSNKTSWTTKLRRGLALALGVVLVVATIALIVATGGTAVAVGAAIKAGITATVALARFICIKSSRIGTSW